MTYKYMKIRSPLLLIRRVQINVTSDEDLEYLELKLLVVMQSGIVKFEKSLANSLKS